MPNWSFVDLVLPHYRMIKLPLIKMLTWSLSLKKLQRIKLIICIFWPLSTKFNISFPCASTICKLGIFVTYSWMPQQLHCVVNYWTYQMFMNTSLFISYVSQENGLLLNLWSWWCKIFLWLQAVLAFTMKLRTHSTSEFKSAVTIHLPPVILLEVLTMVMIVFYET